MTSGFSQTRLLWHSVDFMTARFLALLSFARRDPVILLPRLLILVSILVIKYGKYKQKYGKRRSTSTSTPVIISLAQRMYCFVYTYGHLCNYSIGIFTLCRVMGRSLFLLFSSNNTYHATKDIIKNTVIIQFFKILYTVI